MVKYIQSCRSCNHNKLIKILNLKEQSIQGSFIYPNKPIPPKRKFDSNILFCDVKSGGCGLVQNEMSISPEILYSNYGYRSSVSNTMKNHLNDIVKKALDLKKWNSLSDSLSVLEIGCNDGYSLKQYPERFIKFGVDPSDVANEIKETNTTIINDCFPTSKLDSKQTFDIISSIACFYDIEKPVEFCHAIKKHLKTNGVWVVEFAYLPSVLENLAYDGMVHEHLALYSFGSFECILKKSGLKAVSIEENDTNGGSLQIWVTHNENQDFNIQEENQKILNLKIKELNLKLDLIETYECFATRVKCHGESLKNILEYLKKQGKRIHIYGMSTKLNTILNYCNIGPEIIDCAAERSKEKWGATTISGIPMISEEESRKNVDIYLVGPYHFKNEILEREKESIEKGIQFLFPLPRIEII